MTVNVLPPLMGKLKGLNQVVMEPEIANFLAESYPDTNREVDFELFLQVIQIHESQVILLLLWSIVICL